jgi:hypothetical protein
MNAILKGFMSLFDWILVDFSKSPSERVDETLEDHYNKFPWIESDDNIALLKDSEALNEDFRKIYENYGRES